MPFARMMGMVPFGIGVTVLAFMWTQPLGGFGAPPLIVRVLASFIALGFVMIGVRILSGRMTDPNQLASMLRNIQSELPNQPDEQGPGPVGYHCSSCGAPLSADADVSPHGDVKCAHCNRWFNIHARS